MDFRILGSLEVAVGSQLLEFGGNRQQTALAVLLLDVNRVVTLGRLVDAIYGEGRPTTSRSQVQISISMLRRTLASHGPGPVISTESQGYALRVPREQVDCCRFIDTVQAARAAREEGGIDAAVSMYREALSLWRGVPFDGIDSRLIRSASIRLIEQQIAAYEDYVDLELELGGHHEVIAQLSEMVEKYPLRERLREQLMLALYRSGRQAEALQTYRTGRQALVEGMGIEPNEQLQHLEYKILTSDETLNAPEPPARIVLAETTPAQPVPRLLPADIGDFTGRVSQIDEIRSHFEVAVNSSSRAVPIIVLVGKPGIGKSAIAIHVAHLFSDWFPDGQLYADLHGASSHPVSPMHLLERFLRALGWPAAPVLDSLEERAEMYRGQLADRRILVVMDDALSETQVQPLIPGNPSCAVLITSRSRLTGIAGAIHIEVDVFDSRQSVELFARIAGAGRLRSAPGAASALAELCGRLPLALRIAGARLSARPHWSVAQLVARLEDETRRLDELNHGEMGVRAGLSLAYENVGERARTLFRRLAILDSNLFSAWVSAPLLDLPPADAHDLLEELVDAQLVETTGNETGEPCQYQFHDLIRVFARERLAAEEPSEARNVALARLLGGLLSLSRAAHRAEYGGDYLQINDVSPHWTLPDDVVERLVASPLRWFDRERHALVSGIRQAAHAGLVELCWNLAVSTVTLFEARAYLDDWRETHEIALEAVRRAGDVRGHAAMLYSLGSLHLTERRFDDASASLGAAAALFEELSDRQGLALVLRNIASIDRMRGRYHNAAAKYEQALEIFRETGDLIAVAYVLHNMAHLRLEHNDFAQTRQLLTEALDLCRSFGSRRVEAQVLHRMGEMHLRADDELADAVEVFEQALAIVRDAGDPTGEAFALNGLGTAYLRLGDLVNADRTLRLASVQAGTVGERLVEARTSAELGRLELVRGRAAEAIEHIERAIDTLSGLRIPLQEVEALILLGEAHAAAGDDAARRRAASRALALAEGMKPALTDVVKAGFLERIDRVR
ncbi:BTAD domain-containing putative transcriptional regulator [Nonomuraea sp. 10N515B]|uniref:BTAD domain-containing putative transcriptional regulator n=1 Tax=Nonomuraea sp. 10N515B TaxID=3457422 RepID=UPI003FCCDB40